MNAPILVTGTHRSGSTWVGRMLSLSPQLRYVHEPFAPMYERSWISAPPVHRFFHEDPSAIGTYAADLDRIAELRPPWVSIARRAGGVRNTLRLIQEAQATKLARRKGARALIKDPFALLSAEWIARRTHADVIVLVRHPAAFASSIKRLNWRLNVKWLLDQPRLMQGDLAVFHDALQADLKGEGDIVDHAILIWRALNSVVLRYEREHPNWLILRYEDLAEDPTIEFRRLFDRLKIPWNENIATRIAASNSADHATEVAKSTKGGTERNSRQAIWTWHQRLTEEEIRRIQNRTDDLTQHWYPEPTWWPPENV